LEEALDLSSDRILNDDDDNVPELYAFIVSVNTSFVLKVVFTLTINTDVA